MPGLIVGSMYADEQFDWVATQDWAPFFSINSALDFREEIGGEERIMAYCNALAKTGGKRLNKRWRGCWMENEHEELTAAMVSEHSRGIGRTLIIRSTCSYLMRRSRRVCKKGSNSGNISKRGCLMLTLSARS